MALQEKEAAARQREQQAVIDELRETLAAEAAAAAKLRAREKELSSQLEASRTDAELRAEEAAAAARKKDKEFVRRFDPTGRHVYAHVYTHASTHVDAHVCAQVYTHVY